MTRVQEGQSCSLWRARWDTSSGLVVNLETDAPGALLRSLVASWGPEPSLLASAHCSFPMGSWRVLSVPPATPLGISLRTPVTTRVQARCQGTREP